MNEKVGRVRFTEQLGPLLPQLRRYARALSGAQTSGDTYVRVMLESLGSDTDQWDPSNPPRLEAFRVFHRVWDAIGQDIVPIAPNLLDSARVADERLAALGPLHRQAYLLFAMEAFAAHEVATILGVTIGKVLELLATADKEIRDLSQSRVLIIEDEPVIALNLQALMEDLGHTVIDICATRAEAVEMARSTKPDIVLADIHLADGSSGLDAAADILERISIPIVFITAFPEMLLTGDKVEPSFLISKPYEDDAVRAAVAQALFFGRVARRIEGNGTVAARAATWAAAPAGTTIPPAPGPRRP